MAKEQRRRIAADSSWQVSASVVSLPPPIICLPQLHQLDRLKPMKDTWLIKNGRIVDPHTGRDETSDLCIRNGIITSPTCLPNDIPTVDADGFVVVPGFLDLHVHFREPGAEEAETMESGSRSAAHGGFTTVVTMPNTNPPADTPGMIANICRHAEEIGLVRVMPAGCITRGRAGNELADLPAMKEAGAIAFSDDGSTVTSQSLMLRAMQIAKKLDVPIMDHALDPSLAKNGVMHEGTTSARYGVPGIPSEAETTIVKRDIMLAEQTGCAIHIQHVSAQESIDLIRNALADGIPVSGEASPHHLSLIDSDVKVDDGVFKMNPPLRSEFDRESLLNAVADGTLQILATDHAPHRQADKNKDLLVAPFGVIGLETAIGITYTQLVKSGLMSDIEWVRRWTTGPAKTIGLPPPSLSIGQPADVLILDLDSEWTIRPSDFLSRATNTPFEGHVVTGRAIATFCCGTMTWNGRS